MSGWLLRNSRDGRLLVFLSSKQAVDSGAHNATDSLHVINWPSDWKMDEQLDVTQVVCCPSVFFLILFTSLTFFLSRKNFSTRLNYSAAYSHSSPMSSSSLIWTVPGTCCNVPWRRRRRLFSRPLLFIRATRSLAPRRTYSDIDICLEKCRSDTIGWCVKVNRIGSVTMF